MQQRRFTLRSTIPRGARRGVAARAALVTLAAVAAVGVAVLFYVRQGSLALERDRIHCMEHLERIGQAMNQYWADSGRIWPAMGKLRSSDLHEPPWPVMTDVLGPYVDNDAHAFQCPSDRRALPDGDPLRARFPARTTWFETEGSSYEWLLADLYAGKPVGRESPRGGRALGGGAADQPIMWDFEPFHGGPNQPGSINILYADLAVRPDDYQQRRRGGGS